MFPLLMLEDRCCKESSHLSQGSIICGTQQEHVRPITKHWMSHRWHLLIMITLLTLQVWQASVCLTVCLSLPLSGWLSTIFFCIQICLFFSSSSGATIVLFNVLTNVLPTYLLILMPYSTYFMVCLPASLSKLILLFLSVLVSPLLFVRYVSAHLFLSINLMCYLHLFERMRGQNASPLKALD